MIKLSVNWENLNKQINLKLQGIEELQRPYILDDIAKASFTVLTERFVKAVDVFAVQNPKRMHHVYEWKEIGNPQARLFTVERISVSGGSLIINSSFLPSRTPVPIDPELLIPGNSGRYVNKLNIFKNKADVMEKGSPIRYTASNMMAFAGRNGIRFLRPGTVVNIINPGGIGTKNSFAAFMIDWYESNAQLIMNSSGLYEKIASETARVLNQNNTGSSAVKTAVSHIAGTFSRDMVVIK